MSAWPAHRARLGTDMFAVKPGSVQIASEGTLWGVICHQGLLPETVIVENRRLS